MAEILTRNSRQPLLWWSEYHHILGHNILAAAAVTILAALISQSHVSAAFLACLTFHLHLLCDVVGARGPDGYQWPIPYLLPFSSSLQWTWDGQWALNAWQYMLITSAALTAAFFLAHRRGYSPLEILSIRVDRIVVEAIRHRFPISPNET